MYEAADFAWIRRTVIGQAGCLTMISTGSPGGPGDPVAASRCFGGRPDLARGLTLDEAAAEPAGTEPAGTGAVAVRDVGSWLLAAEINGWQGAREEVLRCLSAGGRAVSAYWNVNAVTRFSYAADGEVVTAFEAISPGRRSGTDPDRLEELRADLPWGDADPVALMLALAGRVTGAPVRPEWLTGEFTVVPLEPLAEDVRAGVDPDVEPLTYDDRPLAWALRQAGSDAQRRAALVAAEYAVGAAGMAGLGEVASFLASPARDAGQLDELVTRLDRAARRRRTGDRLPSARFWAVTSLREAANPAPLAAGFKAVAAAFTCLSALSVPPAAMRAAILGALGDPVPPSGSLGLTASPGPPPAGRYRWITRHWLAPAGALILARPATPGSVALTLGGDLDRARDGIPSLSAEPAIAVRQAGDWVAALESQEPVAIFGRFQRLPAGQVTVSVSWSARGRSWLHYLRGDHLLAGLDPQRPGQRTGSEPGLLDPYLAGLAADSPAAAPLPVLLVLAERLTGLALTPERLDQPHLLVPFRPGL